jgi:Rrf2 family iron-sulfur cluster assembly transcriptional regulator
MLDLALHQTNGPISLADIAFRQDISLSYLEQLFVRLRRRGLVKSTRGPGGGYSLAHDPKDIALADIVLAVDEKVDSTGCGSGKDCQSNQQLCLTHALWAALNDQIKGFLAGLSLAETISRSSVREVAARQDMNSEERSTGLGSAYGNIGMANSEGSGRECLEQSIDTSRLRGRT